MSSPELGVPDLSTYEGIDMSATMTPFYIGAVTSFILSGITILQAWNYFPSRDRPIVQVVAAISVILDLVSTGLVAGGLWSYLIPHFGSVLPLNSLVATLGADCYFQVLIILISQTFFAWQTFSVLQRGTSRYVITAVIMILAITTFCGGIACSTFMIIDKTHILFHRSYRFAVSKGIAKGSASLCDIVATITFCWTMRLSRTGIKSTDSLIKSLISYIVQRGILVTTVQILFLLMFFLTPQHTWWVAFHPNVTKLYTNTFLAMLNGRGHLRDKVSNVYISELGTSGVYNSHSRSTPSMPVFAIRQPTKTQMSESESSSNEEGFNGIQIEKTTVISAV